MGSKSSTTKVEPWREAQPFLKDTLKQAGDLFADGRLSVDNVGLGATTKSGIGATRKIANNNRVTSAATGGLGDFLGAPAFDGMQSYGGIDKNFGNQAVYDSISDQVLPQVAGMFGQGGFTNSTTAQQVAADALGSAMAPYAYDQINRNQQMDLDQFNTEQDRAFQQYATERGQTLQGLGLAPSINQMQYGDANALMGIGGMLDQQRLANQSNDVNEINAAAQLFGGLSGLGGSTTAPTGQSTAGSILGGGAAGLGTYGALLGSGVGAPLAIGGGLLAGLGSIF